MYAEDESDSLVFQQGEDGLELVETPFAQDNASKVRQVEVDGLLLDKEPRE